MSTEHHLLDVIQGLNSSKKKEKIGALENLVDLLNQERIIKLLNRNSEAKNNSINWEIVFIRTHNAVLSIIDENNSKSQNIYDRHQQIIQNVILQVVQKSCINKTLLINSNIILSSTLAVFESKSRTKFLGCLYFNIFTKYVLSNRKNWCKLKEEYWIGIKNICKNYFNHPPNGMHGSLFLEILIDIIRCSSKTCQITHNFVDLFDFLKEIFISHKKSGTSFEIILLRLTNTLCLQLAVEFRYKVCEFMENVFDSVINFHEKKKPEKNILVYHFLTTTLNVHNPDGVWEEKPAYAHDVRKWKSQIREIYLFCCEEVKLLLKSPNESEIDLDFLDVFVYASHLVYVCQIENLPESNTPETSYSDPGPSNKRKCLDTSAAKSDKCISGKFKYIKLDGSLKNISNDLKTPNSWFWLKFLNCLIHKFPTDLKNEIGLVEILYHIICDRRNVQNTKTAMRCLCGLIEIESLFMKELNDLQKKWLSNKWYEISKECLRCLRKDAYLETHALVRSLVQNSKIHDSVAFIKLFCNGSLTPSSLNFKTLSIMVQSYILPEELICENDLKQNGPNHGRVKIQLLEWLLKGEEKYQCKDLAKTLIALILKRFEGEIDNFTTKENTLISRTNINDFCRLITNNYMMIGFKNIKFLADSNEIENNLNTRVDSGLKMKLVELLVDRGKYLMTALNSSTLNYKEQLKCVEDCLWFCELLCHLISYFEIVKESEISVLIDELESLMFSCTKKCLDLIKIKYFDLTVFSTLYDTHFHQNIAELIKSPNFISLEFLQAVFEIFAQWNVKFNGVESREGEDDLKSASRFSQLIKNSQSILNFKSLTKQEKLVINSVEFLCQYIAGSHSKTSNQYQHILASKIIDSLTSGNFLNVNCYFHLQLILRVVYNFTQFRDITASELNSCLYLVELIVKSSPTDPEVIITVLQCLKDFLPLAHGKGDSDVQLKYMEIFEGIRSLVIKRKSGIKTVTKFIECLAEMSKIDLDANWTVLENENLDFPVFQDVVNFLKHSYLEVRLAAAQAIGMLFKNHENMKDSTISWQKEMLDRLLEIFNNEEICPKEKNSVTEYFAYAASSISLISIANIICLSSYWRKIMLFRLVLLAFRKKIKTSEIENILSLISKELKISSSVKYVGSSISYLLLKWAEKDLHVKEFPFHLLGIQSLSDFLQSYFSTVIAVYLQVGKLEIMNFVSSNLKIPEDQLIKKCHPVLMSFVLLGLSESANSDIGKKALAVKCIIETKIPSKTSIQWLTESLDEVIFHMIRNMHDPKYLRTLYNFTGNLEDNKTPSSFNHVQIKITLENLSANEENSLLGKVALEVPAMIQKILLSLHGDLEEADIYEDKIFAFSKYIFFVEMVGEATNKGMIYRNINTFFIQDVVYTLAKIMRQDDIGVLTDMGCECLRKIAVFYIKEFSSAFGKFLPTITTVLIPLARKSSQKPLEVLNFLIYDNFAELKSDILNLDPFPPEEVFRKINDHIEKSQSGKKNLSGTIEHFIKAGKSKNSGCRIEGLKILREILSREKLELREMYQQLKKSRGFSEDCNKSLLHQLICMLVELTTDQNVAVQIEAASCLGELGPSDLKTLVLRPNINFASCEKNSTAITRLIKTSVIHLLDLLMSDDFEVKKTSSKALRAVLSTDHGFKLIESSDSAINAEYLTPFVSKSANTWRIKIKKNIFLNKLNCPDQWLPTNHEKWIVNLVDVLLESIMESCGVVNVFRELIKINWQFAENIFPAILDFILSLKDEKCNSIINKNVNRFFEENFDSKNKSSISFSRSSVYCMTNVVDYIRIQRNREGIYQEFDLKLNYLHVSKAALHCSAFFTSVFYAELWFEEKKKKDNSYFDVNTMCEMFPEEGLALTEILRECHSKIGNSDGIHGCGYMHILEPSSEIQHYEHLKNWNLSLLYHDIQLSQGNVNSEEALLNSLERSGMYYTLNHLTNANTDLVDRTAVQYKCAARLNDWTLLEPSYRTDSKFVSDCFDKCCYFALKAFHCEDDASFQNETNKARKAVLKELTHCSLESSKNLYIPLSELQILKELEEFNFVMQKTKKLELLNVFEKWKEQDEIDCGEFRLIESVLMNRAIMIRDKLEKIEDLDVKACLQSMLCEIYYKLIVESRKERKHETALRMLTCADHINQKSELMAGKMKLEKSRILWERGDKEIGRFLLSHFLKRNEITGELKAKSLRIYGDWMAKTKSENSQEIIEKYYMESITQSNDNENRNDSFASLAKFADDNYEQLNEYLSSPLFEIKQSLINTQQDLALELRQELGWNQNREKRMAYQIASKQSAIDENEIKNSKAERDSYLNLALKYYLLSLKNGERYNWVVFRIVSLWLSNASNPEVIQHLQKKLQHIPTYKFLCLLPQLVPRMADICLISDLIEKILEDHPHHTLPLIFALKNLYEDLKYNEVKTSISTPRVLAAKSLLEKFQNHQKLKQIISEMEQFSSALIELANYVPNGVGIPGVSIAFPNFLKIKKTTNLTSVAIPSLHIPFNKNCTYDDVIGVYGFEDSFYLVGGVNLPKRIKCIGTDGVSRTLLVKGKDDLRQDAVMQQVFTIMNSFLYQNSETNKRKLVVRTYKVVPLSQRSGIIEWCENTQPLSLYLIGRDGKSGAHKNFYPNDTTAFECRSIIKKVFAKPQVTNNDKLNAFLNVCKQIHPVFHHFFIEKFPTAGVWFERRLAYIHSVASSSMIGYILGIGDRHVHNILIDNETAEVIHIDLGIAFEQGKTLPTPETVPFRLTRDIVDGMGLSGIEGDFRISCVKTMEVLRENQDIILTLLEVLLYDPLYTWTITPEKAYSLQNFPESSSSATDKSSSDMETNKMAERALIRLKQKLQGTEAGCVATNVEGQVNYLIQQARDPNNLCRLFHGWQAYL